MAAKIHVHTYRVAVAGDEAGILKVFAEVAPEVPTAVRPQTEGIIKELVATGDSWVAIDADDKIVEYALAAINNNTLAERSRSCRSMPDLLPLSGAQLVSSYQPKKAPTGYRPVRRWGGGGGAEPLHHHRPSPSRQLTYLLADLPMYPPKAPISEPTEMEGVRFKPLIEFFPRRHFRNFEFVGHWALSEEWI
jgi:hypothetical protein